MRKSQLVLALGLVASCAKSVPPQSPVEVKLDRPDYIVTTVAEGDHSFYQRLPYDLIDSGLLDQLASVPGPDRQIPYDSDSAIWTGTAPTISQTAEDASYSPAVSPGDPAIPGNGDEGWAAKSLLLVCALATILRNSYYKVHTA
jgi:hypothetical protein